MNTPSDKDVVDIQRLQFQQEQRREERKKIPLEDRIFESLAIAIQIAWERELFGIRASDMESFMNGVKLRSRVSMQRSPFLRAVVEMAHGQIMQDIADGEKP